MERASYFCIQEINLILCKMVASNRHANTNLIEVHIKSHRFLSLIDIISLFDGLQVSILAYTLHHNLY